MPRDALDLSRIILDKEIKTKTEVIEECTWSVPLNFLVKLLSEDEEERANVE